MNNIRFENPGILLLILPSALFIYHLLFKGKVFDGYPISSLKKRPAKKNIFKYIKFLLISLSLILLIIGSSTPLSLSSRIPIEEKGHAFIFCLDISSTMKALDYAPQNRLDKAKEIIDEFIKNRNNDFFGIVIFAKYSFPYIPLTSDVQFVLKRLKEIELDMIDDGTAIGNAIISAVEQLKNYKGESKNIILITDGINNEGYIHPIYAANEAKKYGIKIYPIAIGTNDPVPFPFTDSRGIVYTKKISIPVDYEILNQISKITSDGEELIGKTSKDLQNIFKSINKQKPIIKNTKSYLKYKKLDHIFYILSSIFLFLFLLINFLTVEVQY